jgi:hypothetical protein
VRSIQSYGRDVASANPGDRVALNIPRPRRDIMRGDCLAAASSALRSGIELVCRLSDLAGSESPETGRKSLRNGLEIEVAVGAARRMGVLKILRTPGFLRLILDSPAPCLPSQRLILIRHGGADILGAATILDAASYSPTLRRLIPAACASLGPRESPQDPGLFLSALRIGAGQTGSGRGTKGMAASPLIAEKAAAGPSPSALAVLKKIETAGAAGLERTTSLDPAIKKEIPSLCEAHLLVPLDTDLFLAASVYRKLLASVLAGKKPGTRFGVSEAKAATGYSRKYALPFLNRMERDGWVKRDGDFRVVMKAFPAE